MRACRAICAVADIRLYVNYKFLAGVHKKMAANEAEHAAFTAYMSRVAARESAAAIQPPPRNRAKS